MIYFKKTLVICLLIIATVFPQKEKMKLEDIFAGKIGKSTYLNSPQWRLDNKGFTYLKSNPTSKGIEIIQRDAVSGDETVLVSSDNLQIKGEDKPLSIASYKFSPDESYILLTGTLVARKIKTGGTFYLYNLRDKKITHIVESAEEQTNTEFSPDGKLISFVRGNNLFVYDIIKDKTVQLTFDGTENIINGAFDWAYEEEFSIIRAYEWAPDSRTIAFWRIDQSQEPELMIQKYDSLYMNQLKMRYPKAGGKNAIVKIGVVDIASQKTTWMDIGKETDMYIPRIKFTSDANTLSIQRLDRLQHNNELLLADIRTGASKIIFTEHDSCWVEITDDIAFLNDNSGFVWTSERDGYRHIYLVDMQGTIKNQLTKGAWEVQKVLGVSQKEGKVYFTANKRGVMYSDLYSINIDGSGLQAITTTPGTHSPILSPDCSKFIDAFSSVYYPLAYSMRKITNEKLYDISECDTSFYTKYDIGKVEFQTFKTSDGVVLNSYMIKPPDFDASKKYPVLVYNYSGPGSQEVKDSWGGIFQLWHQYIAQNGYIIYVLDNRGTGGRGKEFKHIVYKDLGHWEVNDLTEGAKYLATLPYVDASRIGIWGWSYGGYTSALTIEKAADYFKAAIAVAPVTDWHFYDAPYTERYMSLPSLNPEGYTSSSVLNYADKLKGKFLLVHGTADDNVHFQNSVKLVEKLISFNKPFQTMYYPEKAHGISGARMHLFNMLTEFILMNL
jgi:dipeptidyl-peptidase-4